MVKITFLNVHLPNSQMAMGVKNLWATKVSGPKKAMHFCIVHYLPLITWGAVYPGAWAYTEAMPTI